MTQIPTTRTFDPELTGYRYPRAVQFYEFQDQAQTLRMAYMYAEPESSNSESVLLLHGKNFSGAYWEPTIRELLRKGFRVIAPDQSRGRDRPCGRPPAQIPACGITALGSYLGCVAAKRASGKGCITRTGGSHRFRIRTIRVQSILVFWLRRRSAFSQCRVTWSQKAATAS